ncbi:MULTISPECIES: DUF779 domain-containing protein [Amycolatopsis]|uniref:DUF779 domain-containing protein n=1 Tax=Amycolatopsis dendrobii TaxID=2760662 RepID=A0A7W3W283_9PSEU|nr:MULTISPECIES: DUF779 domain-containing protein [Amycolatopsis]MBB1157430.1 DUF779 domain-containing protein [Amycolatopsis dendrobii]UKD59173.1 DUF779 domain-containing protein [Amycolatopsis sp. FU40]
MGGQSGVFVRVGLTPAAEDVLLRLRLRHGPLMVQQTGTEALCYPHSELRVGRSDVLIGELAGDTQFWMSADQCEYWRHTRLTVDVVPGRGDGFSLEAPEGVRFQVRSRALTDVEATAPA